MSVEVLSREIKDLKRQIEETFNPTMIHQGQDAISYMYGEEPRLKNLRMADALERQRMAQLPQGYRPHSVFKSFGSFLQEGVRAYSREANSGANAQRQVDFSKKIDSVYKSVQGLGSSIGSEAGFAILPEFAPKIHDRVWGNDLLSRLDQYTVSGNRMTFPRCDETSRATGSRAGGLQAYWVDEGQTMTGSKPKMAETELRLKKLAVVVYLTQELLDDNSYALEQWVQRKVQEEILFMVGNSIVNGTGVGMPLGFLKSPALISIAKESGQAADTIKAENIVNMYARRLANTPTDGWVWLMHQSVEAMLQLMYVATGSAVGQLVYMPPTGLAGGKYATLQGIPILPIEFAPTLGDAGDISLVNLREIVAITKGGITQAQSTEVEFLTDQLAIKFTMRLDARPYDVSPVTPFAAGSTTPPTQSAFITLDARA